MVKGKWLRLKDKGCGVRVMGVRVMGAQRHSQEWAG